jgi:hypothetical protein
VVTQRVVEANVNVHAARMRNSKYADGLRENAVMTGLETISLGHWSSVSDIYTWKNGHHGLLRAMAVCMWRACGTADMPICFVKTP